MLIDETRDDGARNAGIRPIHLDAFAHCPLGLREHVANLGELASIAAGCGA